MDLFHQFVGIHVLFVTPNACIVAGIQLLFPGLLRLFARLIAAFWLQRYNISPKPPKLLVLLSVCLSKLGTIGLFLEIELGALPVLVEIVGVRSIHEARRDDGVDFVAFHAGGLFG